MVWGQNGPVLTSPVTMPPAREVLAAYYEELDRAQRGGLLSWLAFSGTFGAARALTHAIRSDRGPFRNVSMGGTHLHHYLWGITLLAGVGAVAIRGEDRSRNHPVVAVAYGAGLALIIDEFALLLDLQDVYWARQGRWSVDVGVGLISTVGSYFAGLPFWRRLAARRVPAARAI